MNVIAALQQRKSIRAFLNKDVEQDKINAILTAARHAPSGTNTQPWQVAVVTDDAKKNLQAEIESKFRRGDKAEPDYHYYPEKWLEPYNSRRVACGLQMYSTLSVEREDKQRCLDLWAANYRAFDAPVMLLFFMDGCMQTGSYMDYGMFLQSLMLAAVEQGLASCPQASLADYPALIKTTLNYPQDSILLCGLSLGYEDKSALVNSYRTPREEVSTFTRYFN
ncbi:MAG: nitroreductase, partial [Gammaproteobacteria bacterium]|nr:nitroreductase [Gammaproteobacteria bacterium]